MRFECCSRRCVLLVTLVLSFSCHVTKLSLDVARSCWCQAGLGVPGCTWDCRAFLQVLRSDWFMSLVYVIAAARYWGLDVLVEKCRDRAKTGSCALSHRPPELPPDSSGAAAVLMFTLKQILHEFCSKLNFILNNVNYLNKISSICHEHQ